MSITTPFPIQIDYSNREPVKRGAPSDPVEKWADGNWYFWDEVWTTSYGPFDSETKARDACREYARTL